MAQSIEAARKGGLITEWGADYSTLSIMSYVVEVIRPIAKTEVQAIVAKDPELAVLSEGEGFMEVGWSDGESQHLFSLSQGRITVTTPNDVAWEKMQKIADSLGAAVVGEEGAQRSPVPYAGSAPVRSGWLGWPVLVVVLAALLVWRW